MLKKFIFTLLCGLLFSAFSVKAAEVTTGYYSIRLPGGWEQLSLKDQMDSQKPLQMFKNKNLGCVVGLSVAESSESARDAAQRGLEQMKAGDYEVSPLQEKDGIFSYSLVKRPDTGWIYYASNGKELSVTTIWSQKLSDVKGFFNALKPADPALFPKF